MEDNETLTLADVQVGDQVIVSDGEGSDHEFWQIVQVRHNDKRTGIATTYPGTYSPRFDPETGAELTSTSPTLRLYPYADEWIEKVVWTKEYSENQQRHARRERLIEKITQARFHGLRRLSDEQLQEVADLIERYIDERGVS